MTFNRPLEQRIYAGSDIFLMPSRFEPCGLNQMVAMRYGAVPVVHATGGLADTVYDYDPRSGEGNGFSFARYDAMALYASLVRATETYRHPDIWRQLMRRCMTVDFSWHRSAEKYVDLYYRGMAARRRANQGLDSRSRCRPEAVSTPPLRSEEPKAPLTGVTSAHHSLVLR